MDQDQFHEPLLVFDGDCGFCRAWVDYWKGLTSDRVNYAPFQEVGERFPQVSREEFASAVKLIMPGGEVRSGAHAVFTALATVPDMRWMLWSYDRFPGALAFAEMKTRRAQLHLDALAIELDQWIKLPPYTITCMACLSQSHTRRPP